jgi:hypothetical protein
MIMGCTIFGKKRTAISHGVPPYVAESDSLHYPSL